MVDVNNYDFKSITDKTVKPEEYFINSYVDECIKYDSVISSTHRMHRILYAKYKKVDLNKVMTKKCQHLTATESHRLLHHLNNFEDMFDGTLGTWNTTPVNLELKDKAKPVCSRPYPLPKLPKAMLTKEFQRLVSLGVLEEADDSE